MAKNVRAFESSRVRGFDGSGYAPIQKDSAAHLSRMLKNSFARRLLKKVQMQGGTRRAE
jgi:hypothetical protein